MLNMTGRKVELPGLKEPYGHIAEIQTLLTFDRCPSLADRFCRCKRMLEIAQVYGARSVLLDCPAFLASSLEAEFWDALIPSRFLYTAPDGTEIVMVL